MNIYFVHGCTPYAYQYDVQHFPTEEEARTYIGKIKPYHEDVYLTKVSLVDGKIKEEEVRL